MMLGKNSGARHVIPLLPVGRGAEIGVWRGDTSQLFLDSGRATELHLVDPWHIGAYNLTDEFTLKYSKIVGSTRPAAFQEYYDRLAESVAARFADRIESGSVVIHRMESSQFWPMARQTMCILEGRVFDWVYIDGSHEKEDVLEDLKGALKIVRNGGVIAGDDYGNKPGVLAGVDQFVSAYNLKVNKLPDNQFHIPIPE